MTISPGTGNNLGFVRMSDGARAVIQRRDNKAILRWITPAVYGMTRHNAAILRSFLLLCYYVPKV